MQLNHLDLQTSDVQRLAAFLVTHFDLVRRSNDRSPAIAILADEAGFTLVLQRDAAANYPDGFHIGFIQSDVATVRAHHARLTAAGLTPSEVTADNRGHRFYLHGPGRLLIEVSTPARA